MHKNKKHKRKNSTNELWIFGYHTCLAAINNPCRKIHRVVLTKSAKDVFSALFSSNPSHLPTPEVIDRHALDSLVGQDSIHQGIALLTSPLKEPNLEDIFAKNQKSSIAVILDQVTDVHNIGAILRSCAAFGADMLILTEYNAPAETGAMAKAASGALELLPIIRRKNLVKALKTFKENGYWCVGMDGQANAPLGEIVKFEKLALVMGAEGKGIRRLTREHCDLLVKIPINTAMESLNVSNAAAIALYEASKKQP